MDVKRHVYLLNDVQMVGKICRFLFVLFLFFKATLSNTLLHVRVEKIKAGGGGGGAVAVTYLRAVCESFTWWWGGGGRERMNFSVVGVGEDKLGGGGHIVFLGGGEMDDALSLADNVDNKFAGGDSSLL